MRDNEEESREQPKKLWIHGRTFNWQWVCHNPSLMKTDILADTEGPESSKKARRVSDLIRGEGI
jgi:hypothetical protein